MIIKYRKTYSNCSDLPLFNFIKVIVFDDLEWLYREEKGKPVALANLWESIFNEYTQLSKDHSSMHAVQLVSSISFLNNKIEVIHRAVHFLTVSDNADLCKMLRNMGFIHRYLPETMVNDLQLVLSATKSLILKRQELQQELETLNTPSDKVSESDYYGILAQLSKHFKFHLDPKSISVMQYLKYMESFKSDIKRSSPNG